MLSGTPLRPPMVGAVPPTLQLLPAGTGDQETGYRSGGSADLILLRLISSTTNCTLLTGEHETLTRDCNIIIAEIEAGT